MKYVRLLLFGLVFLLSVPSLLVAGKSTPDELSLREDLIIDALDVNPEEAKRLIASLYDMTDYDSVLLRGMSAYYEGELAYMESRWQDAALSYGEAAVAFEGVGDNKKQSAAYNNLGLAHSFMGNYDKSLWAYEQSLKVELEIDNHQGIAECYQNMAIVFAAGEQEDKALHYYDKALDVYRRHDLQEFMAAIYNNKAVLFAAQGNFVAAEESYQSALAIYSRLRESVLEARVLSNLGALSLRQGKYDGVGTLLEKALFLFKAEGDRIGEVKVYGMLGDLYSGRKDFLQAVFLYQMAVRQAGDLQMKDVQAENQFSLYSTYKAAGMPAEALTAYEEYVALRDELLRENPEYTKGVLGKELEQQIAERDLLLYKSRSQTVLFAVGLGLMAFVALLSFWLLRKRRRRMDFHRKIDKSRRERLRERINPEYVLSLLHGVRDCLNREDAGCARERLEGVTHLMQNVLENFCESLIPLSAEMEYVKHYLLVQKQQLGIDLVFRLETNMGRQAGRVLVPAMLMQPFLDQALQGVKDSEQVVVNIAFMGRNHFLEVVIENNIQQLQSDERKVLDARYRALGATIAQEQALFGQSVEVQEEEWGGVWSEALPAGVGYRLRFNLPLLMN